jgi:ADP-ribose pyrophosphatase
MAFEVVNQEIVYRGAAFGVRRDQLHLPDGRLHWLDIVDHGEAVIIVPVDREGMIWFVRQYRHPAGKNMLEVPAGMMEIGEDAHYSAQRELREEIGMAAGKLEKIGGFYLAPGYSSEYAHIYLATELSPDPLPGDQDEFLELETLSVEQALALAESGQIEDAKSIAALTLSRPRLAKMGLLAL